MTGPSTVKTVPKPWGHETIWAHTDTYVGKILHITAGQALSVQYHNIKDETVYLLSGNLIYRVWDGDTPRNIDLKIGEAYRITPGTVHQMEAVTDSFSKYRRRIWTTSSDSKTATGGKERAHHESDHSVGG